MTKFQIPITKQISITKSQISNFLLILWLVLIPTQLGRHFWPEWSYVQGLRIDYLSPTLYLIDLVWIGWWILGRKTRNTKQKTKADLVWLFLVVVNVLVAGNKWIAIYRWVRWWQWWETVKLIQRSKIRNQKYLMVIIPVWIALESLLGLAQVSKGGSLQGIFYWLGERRFTLETLGVAQMSWLSEELLRIYGTFSHPNSLAGFLLVSGLIWLIITKGKDLGIKRWIVMWLLVTGIILTGSRVVWLLASLYSLKVLKPCLPAGRSKSLKVKGLLMVGVMVVGVLLAINQNYRLGDYFGGWDRESLGKRKNLALSSLSMIRNNPLLGVGLGNFLVRLPEYQEGKRYLQPVHNIFLLWLAETGVLGVLILGWWVTKSIQKSKIKYQKFKEIFLVILVTGMADHYWLTLPQNMWLLAIVFGML